MDNQAAFEPEALTPGLLAVFAYWADLGGETLGCSRRDLDLMKLPSSLVPTTILIDIADPMENSTYRFWGSGLTRMYGSDMTGQSPYGLYPEEFA
jgi:hypothetical protein